MSVYRCSPAYPALAPGPAQPGPPPARALPTGSIAAPHSSPSMGNQDGHPTRVGRQYQGV